MITQTSLSNADEFLKQNFRFVRIISMQEPLPLKHLFDLI